MNGILNLWMKELKSDKKIIFFSFILLLFASILDVFAGNYVDKVGGIAASDIILDNIPTVNLNFFYIYLYLAILSVFILYPLIFDTKKFPIVISQFSLLIMIRSFFITLTHLKIPSDSIPVVFPNILNFLSFRNDLFFSGHVAVPFLGFLIFRKEKLGKFFLLATFLMAIIVLFMHVHYSIDVFAAFFIAYGSYKIGVWFFNKLGKG
jgi:hypothetical protein